MTLEGRTIATYDDTGKLPVERLPVLPVQVIQGADGPSAYEIAVGNGFVGTEQAWLLSLKGDPGEDAQPHLHPYEVQGAVATHAQTPHGTQPHAISGVSHTGTLDHSALSNQTPNQHHNQAHAIGGADHTGSLTPGQVGAAAAVHTHPESDVTGLTADLTAKAPTVHTHAYEPAGAVSAHEGDATAVHGIANTAALVLTGDARLSDARNPLAHTHAPTDTTGTAVVTNDPRLSDARTPLAHVHNPVHTVLPNDTLALALATNSSVRLTVTANRTLTTTVPVAGATRVVLILTSGTTSFTITFGSGFKPVGTLATGTVSARVFAISFISDGTNLYETGRTAAIIA